ENALKQKKLLNFKNQTHHPPPPQPPTSADQEMRAPKPSDKCQAAFPPHPRLPAINAPQMISDSW
ncbi:unnamed protein product, partial [Bubo scandiacus]